MVSTLIINRKVQPGEAITSSSVATENTRNILNTVQDIIDGEVAISPIFVELTSVSDIPNPQENVVYKVGGELVYWDGSSWISLTNPSTGLGPVTTVRGDGGNQQTGNVILSTDDFDDDGNTNKFVTEAQRDSIGQSQIAINDIRGDITDINNEITSIDQGLDSLQQGKLDNVLPGPNINIDYTNPLAPVISATNTSIEEILDKTFKYTGDFLTGVEFSNGAFKVLNYLSSGQLDTLLFANNGFNILKQFNYDNLGRLISITETQV